MVALAEALRTEYRSIVDAGFLLQVDDARAAVTYDRMVPPGTFDEYYAWLARHVDVLNHALEGIPQDRIRYHVCWGSWPGPHTTDVPLRKIVDLILKVNAGRTSSRRPTRATSTNGKCGRRSNSRRARSSCQGS